MPCVRGIFRVMEVTKFAGQGRAMVRMESTQVTSDIFAGRLDLMVVDPQVLSTFELGGEMTLQVMPVPRVAAEAVKR
jgi:hypothetical protein